MITYDLIGREGRSRRLSSKFKSEFCVECVACVQALGIDPNDSLTTDLLKQALVEDNQLYASQAARAEL